MTGETSGAGTDPRSPEALPSPDPALRAVVVIPARDEAERIGRCLVALARQRYITRAAFEVILVLDDCVDGTAQRVRDVAPDLPGLCLHVIELHISRGVGWARRTGMDLACSRLLATARPDGLIASTDADSAVADDWLAVQLELVRGGARAIGGHIELHTEEARILPPGVLADRTRRAGERMRRLLSATGSHAPAMTEHHQFSGASLALTARTYAECGGLPARMSLEDEALERELGLRHIPIHRSRAVRVSTSARLVGRTTQGLARDLALANQRAAEIHHARPDTVAAMMAGT